MPLTGRAREKSFVSLTPCMFFRTSHILACVLAAWQIWLLVASPLLHECMHLVMHRCEHDCTRDVMPRCRHSAGAASACGQSGCSACGSPQCDDRKQSDVVESPSEPRTSPPPRQPCSHDCDDCRLCQVLLAPRLSIAGPSLLTSGEFFVPADVAAAVARSQRPGYSHRPRGPPQIAGSAMI